MVKSILVFCLLFTINGYSQTDTVLVPERFGFSPELRTVAVEGASFLFVYSSYGATVDLDLVQLPFETVQGAGIRVNYQEYRDGFFTHYETQSFPVSYVSSAFLRASFKRTNTRSDVFIGFSSSEPNRAKIETQSLVGIEIRTMIVRPLSSVFIRLSGGSRGMSFQIGISVGYVN